MDSVAFCSNTIASKLVPIDDPLSVQYLNFEENSET